MDDATTQIAKLFEGANAARVKGDFVAAESKYLECIALFRHAEGEASLDGANLYNVLAGLREQTGNLDGALVAATDAARIMDVLGEACSGETPERIRVQAWNQIGNIHRHRAHYAEAETWFLRSLAYAIEKLGDESNSASYSRNNLGMLYSARPKTTMYSEIRTAYILGTSQNLHIYSYKSIFRKDFATKK